MIIFEHPLDPGDELDFEADFAALLDDGEGIASFTVELSAKAQADGLELGSGVRAPSETAGVVRFWASVADAQQGFARWNGAGTVLPVTVTVVTDSVPARTFERDFGVRVWQG